MIKLEFKSDEVNKRSGNKNGRDWTIHQQEAWILRKQPNGTTSPYPEKVTFVLEVDKNGKPLNYEAGVYEYDVEASIYIGDFNSLRLGRPVLRKLQAPVKAAA